MTQGSQTRTFVYDALARPTDSTTPEAGHVNLVYNSWDLLSQRTDARGVVTTYQFDSLNRLVGIAYPTVPAGVSAMPNVCTPSGSTPANVCFAYGTSAASNNNGRLTSMTDPSGSESYSYDTFGNVTQLSKVIGSTTYNTNYQYNHANQLSQITYPSGRAVAQNLDTLGRLSSVVGTFNSVNTTYASTFVYNAAQQTTGLKYGNNIYASFGFSNDRLQLNCLDYSTTNRSTCAHDATTKFGLTYSYPASPGNNGQIAGVTDSVDNGRSITFGYDSLYRLTSAVTTGSTGYPQWGLSETYDRYGNRTAQTVTAGTGPSNSVSVSATTNRITTSGYAYDASGNMTNDGVNTVVYDGENRVTSATSGSSSGAYTYDGNGVRVKKCVPNCTSPTSRTVYIFSGGKDVAEYDNGAAVTAPTREFIYGGSQLLANLVSGTSNYFHRDHLSNRIWTDASTANVTGQRGHHPFGETWYESGSATKFKFTTYERDSESGNDYAMARSYVNRLSRFSSPDPLSGGPSDPQTFNRYSYVQNHPTYATDPSGMGCNAAKVPSACKGLDGGTGAGGGSGVNCTLDGVWVPCDLANRVIGQGAGQLCLDPSCSVRADLVPVLGGVNVVLDLGSGFAAPAYPCPWGDCRTSPPWVVIDSLVLGWVAIPGINGDTNIPGGGASGRAGGGRGAGDTYDQRALALANALNKTGVQSLSNPCTYAMWYGASALGGLIGGAAVGGEVTAQGLEAVATYWPNALQWLNKMGYTRIGPGWLYFAGRAARAAPGACNAIQ